MAVQVSVDSQLVAAALAADPRPGLVPVGVAPNAQHGFHVQLPAAAAAALAAKGKHTVEMHMVGSPNTAVQSGVSSQDLRRSRVLAHLCRLYFLYCTGSVISGTRIHINSSQNDSLTSPHNMGPYPHLRK